MFRNHCSNVVKNKYDNSYYHLTHNQLRRFENVCFFAMPFYKLDISSLLEILAFNFISRSGDRLKLFVEVFCFSFLYVSAVFLLGTEVYFNSSVFFLSIAQDIQNMSLNKMRRRSYIEDRSINMLEIILFFSPQKLGFFVSLISRIQEHYSHQDWIRSP